MSEPWGNRRRHVIGERLAWFSEPATEEFWERYFDRQLEPSAIEARSRWDCRRDKLGRLLLANLPTDGRHLEAGCGAGQYVFGLRLRGLNVEGVDYSEKVVRRIKELVPAAPIRSGDVLALDAADGSYDSYLSFGVVEHRREGPEPFLTEARRVLRPGGVLALSVPYFGPVRRLRAALGAYEPSEPDVPFYQWAFCREDLCARIEAAGFAIDALHPLGANRLLEEESSLYRFLAQKRGETYLRRLVDFLLGRLDGHTILVLAHAV